MVFKYLKILLIITSFLITTGFSPGLMFLAPATTMITSGNMYKASAQFIIDHTVKKKTGKNSITLVKEEIEKKETKRNLQKELRILVEKRIKITRQKLDLEKINQQFLR